jgi:tripartite-type tricarboxylate transporter receptor subunit TctC
MKTFLSAVAIGVASMVALAAPGSATDKPAAGFIDEQIAQAAPKGNFDAAKYFSGKTIRVIVGFAPGGGTDLQARHFAAHWGDYIPGKPRMAVTNITPDITAGNRLHASPPDGLTLEMTAGSNVVNQFTNPQAKFKIEENRIVGTHTASSSTLFAAKNFPYKTLKDAIGGKTVMRIGSRGPDTAYAMRIAALSKWLDFPVKFVSGLSGTSDNLIAVERGDIDGYLPGGGGTVWYSLPTIRPGWLKDGTVRVFALTGPTEIKLVPNKEIPMPADTPYALDLIKDPVQKKQFEIMTKADTAYGKVWMAPPNTPDHIIDVLRKSYEDVLANKEFRAKLEELMGEPVNYTHGAEIEKELDAVVKGYAENVENFKEWITWAQERF